MFKAIYGFFHKIYHKRYHGIYRHAKKLFAFDLGLLALALIMFGASIFFFFWKPTLTDLIDLSFSIGEQRIKSGEDILITINYQNRSKFNLENAILAVHLPPGFIVDRNKTPKEQYSDNSTINLRTIEAGAKGRAEIYGRIFAEPNKEEKILGYLTYERSDTKAKEQKTGAAFFKANDSVLTAEVAMADSSFPGHKLPVTVKIFNGGDKTLANIYIALASGTAFADDKFTRDIELKPGETKTVSGAVEVPAQTGKYTYEFSVGAVVNGNPIRQSVVIKELQIYYPDLVSEIKLAANTPYADPGQTIPAIIYWKNNGQVAVNNLRLIISPTPGVIDLRATAGDNNMTVAGTELIADKKTRTALADGQPGNSDQFEIRLHLLPHFSADGGNLEIKIKTEAEMSDVAGQKFIKEGAVSIHLPLVTEISLNIKPIYYTAEGDQLGRGPLPPAVGQTTKYWVGATLNNTSNPISGNAFRATLGDGVEFTGKQSVSIGPELKFDSGSRTVSWNFNLVPAQSEVGLYFEVAVKPSAVQIGRKILLIKNAAYLAADDLLGKQLEARMGSLDNSLGKDDQGRYAGAEVVE